MMTSASHAAPSLNYMNESFGAPHGSQSFYDHIPGGYTGMTHHLTNFKSQPEFGWTSEPFNVVVGDEGILARNHQGMSVSVGMDHHYSACGNQNNGNRASEGAYVHDPYSFASYAVAHISYEYCDHSSNSNESSGSDSGSGFSPIQSSSHDTYAFEEGDEIDEHLASLQRRRRVSPPCGHEQYKRLRFKKGLSHFLCTVCSTKWKQSGV